MPKRNARAKRALALPDNISLASTGAWSNLEGVGYKEGWRRVPKSALNAFVRFLYHGVAMTSANVSTLSLRKILGMSFIAAAAFAVAAVPQAASAQTRISGAGISKVARDTRKVTISASVGTSASGTIAFIHNSPAGLTRFRGQVTCVSVSGGVAQVTGTIDKGETATGALLDGKSFGITIGTATSPQTFSMPAYGDSIPACSGSRGETIPVTEDGFKLQ
jgi:hypothetical protein